MGTTVPLQLKLTSQRLMVSTRNTSRSNTNPPRIQDQLGDVDSRPPGGALETVQANTNEVEAVRVTNQHFLKELEQLTRKIRLPQETRQARKTKTLLPEKSNTSTLIEKRIEKEKLATPGSMILTNPRRGSPRGYVMGAKVQGHPARNQPHEDSGKRPNSSLHGCPGTTDRIFIHR